MALPDKQSQSKSANGYCKQYILLTDGGGMHHFCPSAIFGSNEKPKMLRGKQKCWQFKFAILKPLLADAIRRR